MNWARLPWVRRTMSAFFLLAFLWGAFQWVQLVTEAKPPQHHATHHT